jgi:cyclopropane fatty-acyl-phospholipid synthase-like methyltransferase
MRPPSPLSAVYLDRHHVADLFNRLLDFRRGDRVVDLGSGTGFVARYIAPLVKRLYCLDIFAQFHKFCANELKSFKNTECHLIDYADFSPVEGRGVNKVFSSEVFIHFNIYDMVQYLRAVHRLLPIGGGLAFDFADGELLDIKNLQTLPYRVGALPRGS